MIRTPSALIVVLTARKVKLFSARKPAHGMPRPPNVAQAQFFPVIPSGAEESLPC
jgi:hypothetical protein